MGTIMPIRSAGKKKKDYSLEATCSCQTNVDYTENGLLYRDNDMQAAVVVRASCSCVQWIVLFCFALL